MTSKAILMLTGLTGLLAAILVGIGEFMLHYDSLARYTDTFAFFEGVTRERATIGHFFGVLDGEPTIVLPSNGISNFKSRPQASPLFAIVKQYSI